VHQERESLEFDILFVGAGPANLASAIHLSRLLKKHNLSAPKPLQPSIAIIDKGRQAGSHLISGAILDTRALPEFLPEGESEGVPRRNACGTGAPLVSHPNPPSRLSRCASGLQQQRQHHLQPQRHG